LRGFPSGLRRDSRAHVKEVLSDAEQRSGGLHMTVHEGLGLSRDCTRLRGIGGNIATEQRRIARIFCLLACLALGCSSGPAKRTARIPTRPPYYSRHAFREVPGRPYGTLGGRIVDSLTALPLQYANIGIPGIRDGDVTREDGTFHIPYVPPDTYSAFVVMPGYERKVVDNIASV
jgi:hypothetical protein